MRKPIKNMIEWLNEKALIEKETNPIDFATQKINDQGVVINTAILKVCMELIDSYNKAIHDFEVTTKYPVNNKSIVQDFYEKYGINQTDDIYTLLDDPSQLSDLEVDLIYILKFKNSKTVQLVKKIMLSGISKKLKTFLIALI